MSSERPRRITSDSLMGALEEAGIVRREDYVRRVVIDLRQGEVPVIHIERYGDERMLRIVPSLVGVAIDVVPASGEQPDNS